MEAHLKILHASPNLIPRILHTVIGIGLLGFFMKLYRPSESNVLFDGASLALYMVGVVVYMANIIKGLRVVTVGRYDVELVEGETVIGVQGAELGKDTVGRIDSLRVLAASNTILALVLMGVLVLQAGQWYAERKQRQEMEAQDAARPSSSRSSTPSSLGTANGAATGVSTSGTARNRSTPATRRRA